MPLTALNTEVVPNTTSFLWWVKMHFWILPSLEVIIASKVCLWKTSPYLTFWIGFWARSSSLGYGQSCCNATTSLLCWLVTLLFTGGTGFKQGLPVFGDGERRAQPLWKGRSVKFIVVIGDWSWNWGTSLRNFRINKKPKQLGFPQKASNVWG